MLGLVLNFIAGASSAHHGDQLDRSVLPINLARSNAFQLNDLCKVHAFLRAEDLQRGSETQGQLALFFDNQDNSCIVDELVLELRYDESEDFATPASNLVDLLKQKTPVCNCRSYEDLASVFEPNEYTISGQSTKVFSTDIAFDTPTGGNATYDFIVSSPDVFYPPVPYLKEMPGGIGNKEDGYKRLSRDYVYVVHLKTGHRWISQAIGHTTFVATTNLKAKDTQLDTIEHFPVNCIVHPRDGLNTKLLKGTACYEYEAAQSAGGAAARTGQLIATVTNPILIGSNFTFSLSLSGAGGNTVRGPIRLTTYHNEVNDFHRKAAQFQETPRFPMQFRRGLGEGLANANSRHVYENSAFFLCNHKRIDIILKEGELAENVPITIALPSKVVPDFDMIYGTSRNVITVEIKLDYKPYQRQIKSKVSHPFDDWLPSQWSEGKGRRMQTFEGAQLSVDIPLHLKADMHHYLNPGARAPVLRRSDGITARDTKHEANHVKLETTALTVEDLYRFDDRPWYGDMRMPLLGRHSPARLPLVGLAWEKKIRPRTEEYLEGVWPQEPFLLQP